MAASGAVALLLAQQRAPVVSNTCNRETARRHDIDPGYLSTRVRARKPAKGYDLYRFARFDDEGNIEGFVFPPGYSFPRGAHSETQGESGRAMATQDAADEAHELSGPSGRGAPRKPHDSPALEKEGEEEPMGPTQEEIDAFFETANQLEMPSKEERLTRPEVKALMEEHLPLTDREWLQIIAPVLVIMSRDMVGKRIRRDRVEGMIKLIGKHGTRKAMDSVVEACGLDPEQVRELQRFAGRGY